MPFYKGSDPASKVIPLKEGLIKAFVEMRRNTDRGSAYAGRVYPRSLISGGSDKAALRHRGIKKRLRATRRSDGQVL